MAAAEKILIVEDDVAIAEMVQARLEREGFRVKWAADGKAGLDAVHSFQPSLVLLDITMPQMNGIEVCKRLREEDKTKAIPIIMVTAHSEEADVTLGLELGADDYVAKPFSVRTLIARIRAVLRRSGPNLNDPVLNDLHVGGIRMDLRTREVRVHGEVVPFTATEFDLLWELARDAGKAFSREELLKRLERNESELVKRNIDVHVMTLRKKLGEEGGRIVTVRGIGYKVRK